MKIEMTFGTDISKNHQPDTPCVVGLLSIFNTHKGTLAAIISGTFCLAKGI